MMLKDDTSRIYREASNYAHYCVLKLNLVSTELEAVMGQEQEAVLNARISNLNKYVKESIGLATRLVEWADGSLELESELTSGTLNTASSLVDEIDGAIADIRSMHINISRKSSALKENDSISSSVGFAHTNVIYLANMFKDATIGY